MAEASAIDEAMAAWRRLAEEALKGAPLSSLSTVTHDGIVLAPLYGPHTPRYAGRPSPGPWQVVQRVDDDRGAASQAQEDLTNGANALSLVFAGAALADGRGLAADTVDALDRALDGILLDLVPLHLDGGARARAALALVLALAERRGTKPAAVHAGIDPAGTLLSTGTVPDAEASPSNLASALRAMEDGAIAGTTFAADGRPVAEAGGTPVQELAFALAALTMFARALDTEGVPPSVSLPRIALRLSADADQFMTIAKLRAARRLFAAVAEACGVTTPATLHATTSARMLSVGDPQTNVLRLTIAAFAAGVGGADAVTVQPFDRAATPFARRMGRNIQTLMLEESHVADFADPAAGAGAVEATTDELCAAAWALFQRHERTGLMAAIEDGSVGEAVQAAAAARERSLRSGERAIIGVTRHPPATPSELAVPEPVTVRQRTARAPASARQSDLIAAARAGATLADLSGDGAAPIRRAPATPPVRETAPFEA